MKGLMKYLKPYAGWIVTCVVLVACTAIASLFLPDRMSRIIGDGLTADAAGNVTANMRIIWLNGGIMLGITLANSILSILAGIVSSRVGCGFGKNIRRALFNKVMSFSNAQEEKFSTASLITRTTNDVTQVQNLIMMALRMMVNVPVLFIGALIMALSKNAQMTLVLLVVIPIIAITILAVSRIVLPIFKSMQKKIDRLTLVSREIITGIRVIRAFAGEKKEDVRFDSANEDITAASLKAGKIMSSLFPAMTLLMNLTATAIVLIAVFAVKKGVSSGNMNFAPLGDMMAVVQYIMTIMMSVIMLSVIFIMIPRAAVSIARINEVLRTEATITDGEKKVAPPRIGEIRFDNVEFAFSDGSKNVVDKVSFVAKKGTVTAIIGGTGSGKSTMINLIPREYDVSAGAVSVDGENVKDFTLNELRSRIAFVTQKAVIFSGDVRSNILYGTDDETRLDKAAEIAQAKDFIMEKDGGYDALVEQGGSNFSGGQKQRLSIARAIASDAEILIFDDSFSALDYSTDARLRKELGEITQDKTILIVAQRIGTVMDADNILVLNEGRLVGEGKHKTLLESCPEYREIALSQLSEEELGIGGVQ